MKSQFDIDSKVVLVSGGAGLLGEVFVRSVLEQNATAVIAEKDLQIAEEDPDRIKIIDASVSIEEVNKKVIEILEASWP